MRLLLPLLLALAGLAAGIGAGVALRPDAIAADSSGAASAPKEAEGSTDPSGRHFVALNNQFIVPVIRDGRISALVVMGLSVEISPRLTSVAYANEPKLRDAFLRVLFDHANAGGFSGAFTEPAVLLPLREALRETAQKVLGAGVVDVLILDMMRQDS